MYIACNILTEGLAPFYSLSNYGMAMNCTVTALYPAAVAVRAINVGHNDAPLNYDVNITNSAYDALQIFQLFYNLLFGDFFFLSDVVLKLNPDFIIFYSQCANNNNTDTLQIGGSTGMDTSNMQVSSYVCGNSEQLGE